jgi:hypothetical protein
MLAYMDDSFSYDKEGNILWYGPYKCYYPSKQTKLLNLWDEIGLLHKKQKQEYGRVLRITGFLVDPNKMRVTMDDEDRTKLLDHIADFICTTTGGVRWSLCEFQQMTGWINWSLNVFPLLKLEHSNVCNKISSKSQGHALIHVNKAVVDDLTWFHSHIINSEGI